MHTMIMVSSPRSGSTVLQALMHACFERVASPPGFETPPSPVAWKFIREDNPDARWALFKVPEMALDLTGIFSAGCQRGWHVLGLIRNPRSLLTSTVGGQPYFNKQDPMNMEPQQRWQKMAERLHQLPAEMGDRFKLVKYEDLLTRPDQVQQEIAAWPDLEIVHPFSEGYKHMKPDERHAGTMNGVRPLDPKRAIPVSDEELAKWGFELEDETRRWMDVFGYE